MPAYRYRAIHATGRVASGHLTAANEQELAQYLSETGLELIAAKVKQEKKRRFVKKASPRMLADFAMQMSDLLNAGVAFIDALEDIARAGEEGAMRDALADIMRDINHGEHIAAAFARHPRLFPPVFTAILAAGEASGDLSRTFGHLARYTQSSAKTDEQLRKALRYPIFLAVVAFAVVTFMMTAVVPQVLTFLNSIDSQLPFMTRLLISVSSVFAKGWWMGVMAIFCMALLLNFLRRHSENVAFRVDEIVLRLPLMGEVTSRIALSRFMHSFAILFQNNVGVLASLREARGTLHNHALAALIDQAEQHVRSGRSLSAALEPVLPSFALRLIRIGEKGGTLAKNLNDVADAYDRQVADATDRMIGSLEPILTVFMGLILAWVVLAVLGPIYGSLSKLSAM
jgi:type IV pilus assembly protein PilC